MVLIVSSFPEVPLQGVQVAMLIQPFAFHMHNASLITNFKFMNASVFWDTLEMDTIDAKESVRSCYTYCFLTV